MPEYTSGSSIRAEQTPPKKSISKKQMVDFRGFPLSTEEGNPLITDKESYPKSEYGADNAPSVVLNSDSYLNEGISSANQFSKKNPAALPIVEQFAETSEVSRSLLGINRETTQQGLFGNVSTYGLDAKDWRVDGTEERHPYFWYNRPSSSGDYFSTKFQEDTTNSALAISVYPSPFTPPGKPSLQDQLIDPNGAERYRGWGQYLNSIIAQYLIEYMVKNFTNEQLEDFNLLYLLNKYPPKVLSNGSLEFNQLYWDKIWLDIKQTRFGSISEYPIIPTGRAINFVRTNNESLLLDPFKSAALWGQNGDSRVIITAAGAAVPDIVSCAWDSFFFNTTRVYYPDGSPEDKGHYRIKTNPTPELWSKYFGLDWSYLRQDLKDWNFKIHTSSSSVTSVENDLKLPHFILDAPIQADPTSIFSSTWPNEQFGESINLPTTENKIGGSPGVSSEVTIKSVRAFRYQPGRISGFTYGSKASEIGAGPGTTIEWGVENDTDGYFFRLRDGADFTIVRRSIIPLEETTFLEGSGYAENTKEIFYNGRKQYETIIEQKNMNGDSLSGEGESGYIINPDTVTMYKIEFGWYGAIGARFYAYIPQGNGDCRWVTIHTLVIENQLGQPCLGDPFFYFRYRLKVSDSSAIRLDQYLYKFGASYYIDGYDKGTLYSSYGKSKERRLTDPQFSQSKTYLNAIDWTTLMGIKPKQYLYNRYGSEIYNKKEIFPKSFSIYSQEDCEIKIIRQEACPEFAYNHQEGYVWGLLPENRRIKAKFSVNNFNINDSNLQIAELDGNTHTATLSYSTTSTGSWRSPTDPSSYSVIGSQPIRVVGDDLFQLVIDDYNENLSGSNTSFRLQRIEDAGYLSSRKQTPEVKNVYLPFTYAQIGNYVTGYDVEFDYYRRDQTLLSSVDIISDEFFIFWTGGSRDGIDATHASTIRIGFVWPDVSVNTSSLIHSSRPKETWGIETPANVGEEVSYDGQKFYEGLPIDFTSSTYSNNTLYIETNNEVHTNTYNLEIEEWDTISEFWDLGDDRLSVPGVEGGECNGLGCKAGREVREASVVKYPEQQEDGSVINIYYLQDTSPWPSLGQSYNITISQGANDVTVSVNNPITKKVGDAIVYLLSLGQTLPNGIIEDDAEASFNIIYIATIDKQSRVVSILASKIAPGNIPFIRVFMQARQGTSMGGVWIGQKTTNGIVLDPFTPHRSTVNIKDSGQEIHGESFSTPKTDGAIKAINTYTQVDLFGRSTAPTDNSTVAALDTYKSIHTSPKKCGSFLSAGGTNAAGILTPTDYPIRWLTNNSSGLPLGTFYVSKNQSVEISLEEIFNVDAESIVNSDDANLATFFIARSLNNHDPSESEKEIYMTLNYDEQ